VKSPVPSRWRPSPAMVIALIALFVSLSGVSYGVATGFIDSREIKNNQVRSLDIRNNEIRTRDLRNNQVRGIDIRNSSVRGLDVALNTLTGNDIAEGSLGKVPSAAAADSATSATTAGSAGTVDTLRIIPRTAMAEGAPPVTLATHGPLTLSAACEPDASETDAVLRVATTQDDSSAGGVPGTTIPTLDAADGPEEIVRLADATHVRSVAVSNVFASAPNGAGFTGGVALYAEATATGRCVFHGHLALQG
jgi:hypothetical protein